jgi:nucleotide-binding universal stress UspA family protein
LQQKIVHPSGARNATPADQIIRAASELEADRDRGKGAVAAVVLGSVAYQLLHHAPYPVLVTR